MSFDICFRSNNNSTSSSSVCIANAFVAIYNSASWEIGSSDVRNVLSAMEKGNPRAAAAINVFVYQIRKYLGAYTAAMNGLDAIVFTGGIGEKSSLIRKMVCNGNQGLDILGIHLDPGKNDSVRNAACEIQASESRVSILVIPTDEEKEIARQTAAILGLSSK